jgi:hypothetical protein
MVVDKTADVLLKGSRRDKADRDAVNPVAP